MTYLRLDADFTKRPLDHTDQICEFATVLLELMLLIRARSEHHIAPPLGS